MSFSAFLEELRQALGAERVQTGPEMEAEHGRDRTENPPVRPGAAVEVFSREEVVSVVSLCRKHQVPLTPRVTSLNIGGLSLPREGGLVVDLRPMRRIWEISQEDQYALIEPGVSWQDMKDALSGTGMRIGYPLAPPETSVVAGCLMDGLGSLTLPYGPMGEWIQGVEVVLGTGEVVKTGAGALSDRWFGRAPLPDLTGLFINTFGITGIVTRLAISLWPERRLIQRLFVLANDRDAVFRMMRPLARSGLFDDVGGISWPAARLLFGLVPTERDPDEPEMFLFLDITADEEDELRIKRRALERVLAEQRSAGAILEGPLDVKDLLAIEPAFQKFAVYPTRLDFLLDHPGRGLTWVGTYGPLSRLEAGCQKAVEVLERYGEAPLIVSRPMRGGHFGVLRYISRFDQSVEAEVEKMRALNRDLCLALHSEGFIPYKMPDWAFSLLRESFDQGFLSLLERVRSVCDPAGIFSPDRWAGGAR